MAKLYEIPSWDTPSVFLPNRQKGGFYGYGAQKSWEERGYCAVARNERQGALGLWGVVNLDGGEITSTGHKNDIFLK